MAESAKLRYHRRYRSISSLLPQIDQGVACVVVEEPVIASAYLLIRRVRLGGPVSAAYDRSSVAFTRSVFSTDVSNVEGHVTRMQSVLLAGFAMALAAAPIGSASAQKPGGILKI